tara:strand:- start:1204 stop:1665 length:462 start_codon:yes stop_codon:yes gene_type:complete
MKKIIIFIFLLTLSCSNNKVIKNYGIIGLEKKAEKIEVSISNKNDVLSIAGKPSSVSMFDNDLWYYMQTEKINQSVLKLGNQKITNNYILEIKFDKYGVVLAKKVYSKENMNDLKMVKMKTQKKYDDSSKIGTLMKSLNQKINSPKKNRTNKK